MSAPNRDAASARRLADFETRWLHLRLERWGIHIRVGVVNFGTQIYRDEEGTVSFGFGVAVWRWLP